MGFNLSKYQNLDTLLMICPTSFKEKILKEIASQKKIIDLSFLTLSEYKKNYFFESSIDAILYLKKKYSLSVENAKIILNNLIYVDTNKTYSNEKLDQLVSYKKELEENHLLIQNPFFLNYLKSKNVVVAGYGELNCFDQSIIQGKTVTFDNEKRIDKKYIVNEFDNEDQEIEFVYDSIFDLLKQGKDINHIYLMNVSLEDEAIIHRFNSYYPFKVELNNQDSLIGLNVIKKIIDCLDESKEEVRKVLDGIEDENLYQQILSILNKYGAYSHTDVKELIIDDFKNTKLVSSNYKDVVKCIDNEQEVSDEDTVFLLHFNDEFYRPKMDIDYINDSTASLVNKPTTKQENILSRNNLIAKLSNISYLVITFSKQNPFHQYTLSNLLSDVEMKHPVLSDSYSEALNKAKYIELLDQLLKYNEQNESLMGKYYNSYQKNDYRTYNNQFNHLTISQKEDLKKVCLSYSSMDNFSKCPFKYYLTNVLKINEQEETFYTKYGSLCHEVLQKYYEDPSFDFDKVWDSYILNYENEMKLPFIENEMEKFFLETIKEEMKTDIKEIHEQNQNQAFDKYYCENKFEFGVDNNTRFKGFIDKLMVKEVDDKVIVSIVDYKTGSSTKFESKYVPFGLSLQLPSYMYLLLKDNKLNKDIEFAGIYIQHLINRNHKYSEDKTLDEIKKDSLMLEGISSNDKARLSIADLNLEEGKSSIIKSISIKKDGSFYSTSKVASDTQFKEYVDAVEKTILDSSKKIQEGEFKINPKQIDGVNKSCEFCPFEAICYKRDSDLSIISTKEEKQ